MDPIIAALLGSFLQQQTAQPQAPQNNGQGLTYDAQGGVDVGSTFEGKVPTGAEFGKVPLPPPAVMQPPPATPKPLIAHPWWKSMPTPLQPPATPLQVPAPQAPAAPSAPPAFLSMTAPKTQGGRPSGLDDPRRGLGGYMPTGFTSDPSALGAVGGSDRPSPYDMNPTGSRSSGGAGSL